MPNGYLVESQTDHQWQGDIGGEGEGDVHIPEMVAQRAKGLRGLP